MIEAILGSGVRCRDQERCLGDFGAISRFLALGGLSETEDSLDKIGDSLDWEAGMIIKNELRRTRARSSSGKTNGVIWGRRASG